uniref:Uncharacterized protein n=1 Tax=Rhizophora mucronata TaxID=61149 RepID=A0A2P2KBD8_RHIMU
MREENRRLENWNFNSTKNNCFWKSQISLLRVCLSRCSQQSKQFFHRMQVAFNA